MFDIVTTVNDVNFVEENVIPEGCSLSGSVIQLDNIFRKLVINFSVKFGFPENVIQPDNSLVW